MDSLQRRLKRTQSDLRHRALSNLWSLRSSGVGQTVRKVRAGLKETCSRIDSATAVMGVSLVIVFKRRASSQLQTWLCEKIAREAPELIVEPLPFAHRQRDALLISISDEGMWTGAEERVMEKPVKEEYGGGLRQFTVQNRECFVNAESVRTFFSTSEEHAMIGYFLQNIRLATQETCDGVLFNPGVALVPLFKVKKLIGQAYPLHSRAELNSLRNSWTKRRNIIDQPIDAVRDYFGQQIAMYFSWLQYYTKALFAPAVFGLLLYFILYIKSSTPEEALKYECLVAAALSIFNVLWSSVFLVMWKRHSSEIAYDWGVLEVKCISRLINPFFKSTLGRCPVTGVAQLEPLGFVARAKLYAVTLPIVAVSLGVSICCMLFTYSVRDYIETNYARDSYVAALPQVMLSIVIVGLNIVNRRLAVWLTTYENHRFKDEHDTSLVIKLIVFQFINSFLTLFYIAFWRRDLDELKTQLAAFLVTRQLTSVAKETIIPYLIQYGKKVYLVEKSRHRKKDSLLEEEELTRGEGMDEETKSNLSVPEMESVMEMYTDTVGDYMEMWVQFGYVVLFSGAFPLTGLLAFANNLLEIRTDSFKLCFSMQRPFAQDANSIGVWQVAFGAMGYIAVAVNCAMLAVYGRFDKWLPEFSYIQVIVLMLIVEHVLFAIKALIMITIPDTPSWVTMELSRTHHKQQQALLNEWRKSQEKPSAAPLVKEETA